MRSRIVARLTAGALFTSGVSGLGGLSAPAAAVPAATATATRAAASAATPAAAPDPRDAGVRFEQVASGLVQPVAIAAPNDGSARIFVVERRGTIRYYRNGALSGTYLDIRSRVHDGGDEQGLLGLAFHPSFGPSRPYFYVTYTKANGTLRVARFQVANPATSTTVSPATERMVLEVGHPAATNHNGGQLAFNRDGYLYIGTGDGGGGGDLNDDAQNRTRLLGKILRIDINRRCGTAYYCVPSSNPYYGTSYRWAIFSYGLRNPWKFSFSRGTGYMYVADVGQSAREEFTIVPYRAGGWNLGWNCYEGSLRYSGGRCLTGVTYRFPTREYGRTSGGTIIGGYLHSGAAYPVLKGLYIYGDYVSGRVWAYRGGVNAEVGAFPGGDFN